MENDQQPPNQAPKLPDLNLPPRPRPEDPGYEMVDGDGNILVPGYKSVDGGHESSEPLKSRPADAAEPSDAEQESAAPTTKDTEAEQPDNRRPATDNSTKEQSDNRQLATGNSIPKALILTGFGINCEEEMAAAYRLAGAEATIVHLNQVLHGHVSIHDYDILNFPGGFSFGDDLGSGVVLANKLRYRRNAQGRTLLDDIREFVAGGKFVLGICNGFQVLVKLGLLPDLAGTVTPEVTLTHNASGRYEDRWVRLQVNPKSNTPFLRGMDTLEVPVRHGEGRLLIGSPETAAAIEARGLNCLSYLDEAGAPTANYPHNPNGADLHCAGLTDTTGRVFGLMPHPEAFLSLYNHPDWARRKRANPGLSEEGEGLRLFRNIVEHIAGLRQPHPPTPSPVGRGSQTIGALQNAPLPAGCHELSDGGLEMGLPTSITDNVFTTTPQKWDVLKEYGRDMRKNPTPAEEKLWEALRGQKLAVKFRRQHTIDSYIVDFVTIPDKLIVEVDGDVHLEAGQAEYDAGRTHALQELGYQLIRFSNHEVLHGLDKVLLTIQQNLVQLNQTKRLRPNL